MRQSQSHPLRLTTLVLLPVGLAQPGEAREPAPLEALSRLVAAYPDHLERIDGNDLVWRDGTRMPLDDGKGMKPFEVWLAAPDIEDMLQVPYPAGQPAVPPAKDVDPGRARNAAFFAKMYGDCRQGALKDNLVEVAWLPGKTRQKLMVSKINGVAKRLEAISAELERLPAALDVHLVPSAGTYNCRPVAGTDQLSAHGYGIAIDIALKHAHYWRWSKPQADGAYGYRNAIPLEIVAVFEAHGFIWGGRWHHFDTMHFEYRPELLPAKRP